MILTRFDIDKIRKLLKYHGYKNLGNYHIDKNLQRGEIICLSKKGQRQGCSF